MHRSYRQQRTAAVSGRPLSQPSSTSLNVVEPGLIVNLMVGFDDIPQDSILRLWNVGSGVFGHPFCVVGTRNNGSIACCVLTTSFGGRPILNKFGNNSDYAQRMRSACLAINNGNTVPHSKAGLLSLGVGYMNKQSYVNMNTFFEVEAKYLSPWAGQMTMLDSPSVDCLQASFSQHLVSYLPDRSGKSYSPLDIWSFTPSSLGVAVPSGLPSLRRVVSGERLKPDAGPHPHFPDTGAATTAAAVHPLDLSSWRRPAATPTDFVKPAKRNCAIAVVKPTAS